MEYKEGRSICWISAVMLSWTPLAVRDGRFPVSKYSRAPLYIADYLPHLEAIKQPSHHIHHTFQQSKDPDRNSDIQPLENLGQDFRSAAILCLLIAWVRHIAWLVEAMHLIRSVSHLLRVSLVLRLICSASHLFCVLSVSCLTCSVTHLFRVSCFRASQLQGRLSTSSHILESVMHEKSSERRQLEEYDVTVHEPLLVYHFER